jgi:hypothetical protein
MCSQDGRTTNPPSHFDQPILQASNHLGAIVVRASSLHVSNSEMCSQDGRTTNPPSQPRICSV